MSCPRLGAAAPVARWWALCGPLPPDPDGQHASVRRLVCNLIEEYGRPTGHADLLGEAADGLVGEDPPSGWHANEGRSRLGG